MKDMFVFLMCTIILSACKHQSDDDDVSNLLAQNLSGTWLNSAEIEVYDISTRDYLYTFFEARTYIFQDSGGFVEISNCASFGETDYLATKTVDSLSFDSSGEAIFTLIENGQLVRKKEGVTPPGQNTLWKLRSTLSKVSNEITVDNGALELIGPISVAEHDHVCVGQNIFSTGDDSTYYISVPFDTGKISLQFRLSAPLMTGSHEFVRFSDIGVFSGFSIASNSDQFLLATGTHWLLPDSANIEITDSSVDNIEGSFSFIGIGGENYSGSFQLNPIDKPL
ncbi:MAG: hypothetical protein V3W04_05300 [Gammaproteobacteria bacterium]